MLRYTTKLKLNNKQIHYFMNTLQDILGELLFQVKARQSNTIDSEDFENAIEEIYFHYVDKQK